MSSASSESNKCLTNRVDWMNVFTMLIRTAPSGFLFALNAQGENKTWSQRKGTKHRSSKTNISVKKSVKKLTKKGCKISQHTSEIWGREE